MQKYKWLSHSSSAFRLTTAPVSVYLFPLPSYFILPREARQALSPLRFAPLQGSQAQAEEMNMQVTLSIPDGDCLTFHSLGTGLSLT